MKFDTGKQFENIAFMHLRRQYKEISYYKDIQEVDFVTESRSRMNLINVCYSLKSKETRERELSGLFEALTKLKLKKGTLVTNNETEKINKSGKEIEVIPMWKWLLDS
jgi:predicted AAA+ superfamily ATPase